MDHMSPLDSVFLHTEDGITHMHVGSCAVFEGPAPGVRRDRGADRRQAPPASLATGRRCASCPAVSAARCGSTILTSTSTTTSATRRCRLPGRSPISNNLMGRVMSQELDRHRPLWEAWMVEGLPDDQWALVSKVHHCMVDGVSGTELMTTLLDPTP